MTAASSDLQPRKLAWVTSPSGQLSLQWVPISGAEAAARFTQCPVELWETTPAEHQSHVDGVSNV